MKGWIITSAFFVILGFYIYGDYTWGTKIIAKNELQLVTSKKDWSIAKPWTWFVQPINKVVWLKQYSILTNPYIVVDIVLIEKGEDYQEMTFVLNLKDKTVTYEDVKEVVALGPWNEAFRWVKPEGVYKDIVEFMAQKAENKKSL